jgi:hypothetical protein
MESDEWFASIIESLLSGMIGGVEFPAFHTLIPNHSGKKKIPIVKRNEISFRVTPFVITELTRTASKSSSIGIK